jgi:hypothetical protein
MPQNNTLLPNRNDIENWLEKMHIQDYIIHDDLTVDVLGNIYLIGKKLDYLPVKFGVVKGNFQCYKNYFTSLENFPHTIIGDLDCSENAIKTLINSPVKIVGKSFNCSFNYLSNLKGMPIQLSSIECSDNPIQINEWFEVNFTDEGAVFYHNVEQEKEKIALFKEYYQEFSDNVKNYTLTLRKEQFDEKMLIFKEKILLDKINNSRIGYEDKKNNNIIKI